MNTSAAATQANVTIATIRTWCRNGVITATKRANRWIIDAASLAWRIALSSLKARKEQTMVDLTATYTTSDLRTGEPTTLTPVIKTRTTADGVTITSVRNLAPLLATQIDAIADEGNRLHTIEALRTASIAIRSEGEETRAEGRDDMTSWRDHGRLATSYTGTADLPVSAVLDLAAAIRTQLA